MKFHTIRRGLILLGAAFASATPWLSRAADSGLFPPTQLENIQAGRREVYRLEYGRAAERFRAMITDAPDDPAGYAYLAWTYWLEELSAQQELSIDRFASSDFFIEIPRYVPEVKPEAEAAFRKVNAQGIEKARAQLDRDPRSRSAAFLLGFGYENLASFEVSLKRNWWNGFRAGIKTYRYHRDLLQADPNFHDARLATGVYKYVTGSLSWRTKWVAWMMGYTGSKQRGVQDLEIAARQGNLSADDARVMLVLIHTREKAYQKASGYLTELLNRYPENHLLHLDLGGLKLIEKKPEEAITSYREVLEQHPRCEKAIVYNRLGVAYRARGDLVQSLAWFAKVLSETKASQRSLTITRLELGKALDLIGQREEARKQYQAVVVAPDVVGSRQEAQRLLRIAYRQ